MCGEGQMHTILRTAYRCHYISTRSERPILNGRFSASFCVEPEDPRSPSWQEFPKETFETGQLAVLNALHAAMGSVDSAATLAESWIVDAPAGHA
jgi:hypothetical protein